MPAFESESLTLVIELFNAQEAGDFGGVFTPDVPFPIDTAYSASVLVENDTEFPPAGEVLFSGPPGSGLAPE